MFRPTTAVASTVLGLTLLVTPFVSGARADMPPRPRLILALSTLGDLGSYEAIATDTLKIVGSGDLMAARTRIKDLETSWDKAESTLKPKDKGTWTTIDKAIDEALGALRTPNPQAPECSAALKALVAKMDAADKA